jgi:Zn-finger nucleic acid-binding protein
MSSACPKCRQTELVTPPGPITGALRCPACRGTWLPRDEARVEVAGVLLESESMMRPNSAADARTGLCPLGHGILIRAKVELDDPFHVERCPDCHGIWFDKGEWNTLAASHLLEHLDDLWDPAWRFRMRAERLERSQRAGLEHELGRPLVDMLETLATALREQTPRVQSLALAYLKEELALLETPAPAE